MFDFNYCAPTEVAFGKGKETQTGQLIKKYGGTKVLLHYGSGSAVRSGLLDRVRESLNAAGLPFVELGGVVPNPRLSKVYEGMELCRKEGVDFLLAVGGGSVIDSCKAIGYGLANEGEVWDFFRKVRAPQACMPLGVVLTIAAAGSEMSDSCVITNDFACRKQSVGSNLGRPKFAVMNPELTMTLPAYQTASGCVDILMHTQERYFIQGGTAELTDAMAEALMRTVLRHSLVLRDDPDNYEARAEVMWASSLSHNGLMACGGAARGDFASHTLEHELGAMFDVAHGAGLAAIWGSWARYVYRDCLHRFKRFALNVMGVAETGTDEEIALKGIEALEDFYRSIDMPTNLRELGIDVTDEQIEALAKGCLIQRGGPFGNVKALDYEDARAIFTMAR